MNHVLATVKEPDVTEFCQRAGMKSERRKKMIILISKELYRRESLCDWPKTHSISEVKLMSVMPPFPALCSILAN